MTTFLQFLLTPHPSIDMASHGISTFQTTGTISASSNSLVVADASGFAINDYLIIETGGESGAGLRGTVGVGGTWPALHYADFATMTADTGKPDSTFCYLVSTGDLYQSFSGLWTHGVPGSTYFLDVFIPLALAAKITGKSGNTLTLDTSASVTATNANVYFDNAAVINAVTTFGSGTPDNRNIVFPAGTLRLSQPMYVGTHTNWNILGAGKNSTIFSYPNGIGGPDIITVNGCTNAVLRDLAVSGNTRAHGYMVSDYQNIQTAPIFNFGIKASSCNGFYSYDTKSIDCFQGLCAEACANVYFYRHDAVLTEGQSGVEAWQIQIADTTGGGMTDCTITSPTWTFGYELFRAIGCSITNCTSSNAIAACNTSDSFTIGDLTLNFTGADWVSTGIIQSTTLALNINSNEGGAATADGGTVSNITITQTGLANAGVTNDTLQGIVVNVDNPNVTIDGGTITLPSWTSPSANYGAVAVNSTGANTTVQNLTVVGTAILPYGNLTFSGSNGRYHNITAGSIVGGTPF